MSWTDCCTGNWTDCAFSDWNDCYWDPKCGAIATKELRDRIAKERFGIIVDKSQAKSYFRKPYYDGWSGKIG